MKKVFKNYRSTMILIMSIIIGIIVGLIFKERASVLSPLGDIFINMLLVIVVPLIFLTITSSIVKMKSPKRLGKVMITTMVIFIITSLVSVIIGFLSTYKVKLVDSSKINDIKSSLVSEETPGEELNILKRTADVLVVRKFNDLFDTNNLIALFVFSIVFGIALNMSKEKGNKVKELIVSLNEVIMKVIKIIMYYAPIGLGCYTASMIGTYGSVIAVGYLKTFIVYTIVSLLFFFIVYTIYAFISGGVNGVKVFWKNSISPTITALATCSSAASIPVNMMSAKKIGVSDDIADAVIPLGTSFHKDGSIIGSVFKVMFLVNIFGLSLTGFASISKILFVSLLATLLVTAVPIGGGTISEMMIITAMGYPVSALPILTIIATIIDAPATMLNVVGDLSSSMLVSRVVDGKNHLSKSVAS